MHLLGVGSVLGLEYAWMTALLGRISAVRRRRVKIDAPAQRRNKRVRARCTSGRQNGLIRVFLFLVPPFFRRRT